MQSLPAECVPVLGTEGESYRRKQCYTQIPLYDFSLDACHKMSDLEKKRFGKLTSRREESFGVGTLKLHATAEDMVRMNRHAGGSKIPALFMPALLSSYKTYLKDTIVCGYLI